MTKKIAKIRIDEHKKEEKKTYHPEAKGLSILSATIFLLLSLVSFWDGDPSKNMLGQAGYLIGFGLNYLFGLTSYLVLGYSFWIGWRLLINQPPKQLVVKTIYFSLFLCSLCILLNVAAESKLFEYSSINSHVLSESIVIEGIFSHKYVRYNYGGVPFYYLYTDLQGANLQVLFSDVGVIFMFSIISLVSFILFTGIRFLSIIQASRNVIVWTKEALINAFTEEEEEETEVETKSVVFHNTQKEKPSISELKLRNRNKQEKEIIDAEFEEIKTEKSTPVPSVKIKQFSINAYKEPAVKVPNTTFQGKVYKDYNLPPLNILSDAKKIDQPSLEKDLKKQAEILEETLLSFGIEAKVGEINCGPTITSFALHPAIGVKVQKIKALENDIALNLQAKSIRIIAPIPGKAAVGVEIPSLYPQEVGFKDMLYQYQRSNKHFRIPVLLGKTVSGENVFCDLTKMPHCIIAGATGSGKSVCINTLIMSILMTSHPDEVKLILIDPKKVELTPFTSLPHMISPVITEAHGAYAALNWLVKEMQKRYDILKQLALRNISAFNNRKVNLEFENSLEIEIPEKMSTIITIIDEFADLMMTSSADLETPIARIAQMARAVGIHLILATQRPSREVITGLIKANFPSRIAFKVASRINSQIILDENGAESLLGNGDLLFLPPGSSQLVRAQGAYIRDDDINEVIDYIARQASPNYLIKSFDEMPQSDLFSDDDEGPRDSMYQKALELVLSTRTASTTFLQRKLKVGYARAASLMDELEDRGVISAADGSKPRKILMQGDVFSED